jgi:hypothetical protein
MATSLFRRFRVSLGVGALILMAAVVSIHPAVALPSIKQFSASVVPTSVEAGSTYTYQFTIHNVGASPQSIGSVNVTLPSSATTAATFQLPAQPTGQPSLSGPGTITTSGTTLLQLRNLSLPPGGDVTATFTAEAPCQASTDYTWGVVVKQSNDFQGPPGNDFIRIGPLPTTDVSGSCHLAFVTYAPDSHSVGSAKVSTQITSEPYNPAGTAVKVAVVSGAPSPTPVTFSTASITLTAQGGGGGSLAGGDSATAGSGGAGIAAFTSNLLSIATAGVGYTMRATSSGAGIDATGTTGPVSNAFNIDTTVADCSTGPCKVQDTTTSATTTYELTAISSSGFLAASLGVQSFAGPGNTCPGSTYVLPPSEGVSFNLVGGTGTKQLLYKILQPDRPASQFQVCFASTTTFLTASGANAAPYGTTGYFAGLLPQCKKAPAPCYLGYTVDRPKAVTLIVNAPAIGDPWTH